MVARSGAPAVGEVSGRLFDPMDMQQTRVPIVGYLVLDPEPHLVAQECSSCGARFFDRRIACAACSATAFTSVPLDTTGVLRTFTIVGAAPAGISGPYVAAIVDCSGTDVRTNIVNVEPDPHQVRLGMKVRLCTPSLGVDSDGCEAIGYAFEPVE